MRKAGDEPAFCFVLRNPVGTGHDKREASALIARNVCEREESARTT